MTYTDEQIEKMALRAGADIADPPRTDVLIVDASDLRRFLALAQHQPDATLRRAAERVREDLGPDGKNYPDYRTLLAFAEARIKAQEVTK